MTAGGGEAGNGTARRQRRRGTVACVSETRYNSFAIQDEVRILPKSEKQAS
ncbi:hypothetical protein CHCC14820_3540 [Bacillus paralicheniformis]|uniref:Uncharacterized protein n=1 Tax=Bacillus paralicheniformis TaxID=1648923 RepID=A0A6N2ET47_9BACI|nr:hypothetical protein B4121_2830 [Bacillus paralicheniformis]TWJ42386.1 hypothetical protein CHCC5027_4206 [Bacillus paralicheniformis]TWJ65841.1 hypothetical protein CHCC5022_4010 [Bacillus paralicheniformis]TWJ66260.1 hypothetical protein CHCC5021_0536 [Bacillus paralicheniformis]TWJ74513.1 hypothetical protein CHCC20497_3598 [Bacillus paralicheniformis]